METSGDQTTRSSSKPRSSFGIVVLVLAALGVGAWLLVGRGGALTGSTSGAQRCFFSATWNQDGSPFDGSLDCRADGQDCTYNGAPVDIISIADSGTGCYGGGGSDSDGSSDGGSDGTEYNDDDYGSMDDWCNAWRNGTCQQQCDAINDTSSGCVSGCENMTDSQCSSGSTGGDSGGGSGGTYGGDSGGTYGGDDGGTYGGDTGGSNDPYELCIEGCNNETSCIEQYCAHMRETGESDAGETGGETGGSDGGTTGGSGGNSSNMHNCFYEHATKNGAYPGFTVWCEYDYVNCHEGHSGGPTITDISSYSLGAPSSCDSGWDDGGSDGGSGTCRDWEAYNNCLTPGNHTQEEMNRCDELHCWYDDGEYGDMGEWCEAWRNGTCQQKCNEINDTSSGCVSGCQNMTSSECDRYGGDDGGDYGDSGGDYGDYGGDYGNDGGDYGDYGGDYGNDGGDYGDYGGDYGDDDGTGGEDGNDENIHCWDEFGRSAPMPRENQPGMRCMGNRCDWTMRGIGYYCIDEGEYGGDDDEGDCRDWDAYNSCLTPGNHTEDEMRRCANLHCGFGHYGDYDDRDGYDYGDYDDRDYDGHNEDDYGYHGSYDLDTEIENFERGPLSSMQRLIDDMRSDHDVSVLEARLSDVRSMLQDIKTMPPEKAREEMPRLYETERAFWDEAEKFGGGHGSSHDPAEPCLRIGEEADRQEESIARRLRSLQDRCMDVVSELQESNASHDRWEKELQSIWGNFEGIMEDVWSFHGCHEAEQAVSEANKAINVFAPEIIGQVSQKSPAAADEMAALLERAKVILQRAFDAMAIDNCGGALQIMSTDMEDIRIAFEAIMERLGIDDYEDGDHPRPIEFVDHDRHFSEIYDAVYEDDRNAPQGERHEEPDYESFKARMEERGYNMQDLVLLQQMDPELIREYFAFEKETHGGDAVHAAALAGVSTVQVEQLVATKNNLLEQIAELEQRRDDLQAETEGALATLESYTFHPSLESDLRVLINRAPYTDPEDLETDIASLIQQSRERNRDDGTVTFLDVDPFDPTHEWFVVAIENMVEEGIFTGRRDGEFAPGEEANVAEIVTIMSRMIDQDDFRGRPTSELGTDMPAWAAGHAAAIDASLVDGGKGTLDTIFESRDPSDAPTRLQVAHLLVGLFGEKLPPANTDVLSDYEDLGDISQGGREAISRLVMSGIMKGSGGKWNPDGTFDRAQFATIGARMLNSLDIGEEEATGSTERRSRRSTHEAAPEETQQNVEEEEEEVDLGFNLESVLLSEFKIIKSIAQNWANKQTGGTEYYYPARKLMRELPSLESAFLTANNPYHRMNLENQLSSELFRVLKKALEDDARARSGR